jgi:glycosyltransferase involved in cell wall biosynthesis
VAAEHHWDFLGRRVLVVSPFPPRPDGIGTYAVQLVRALSEGREITRLGLPGSDADASRRLYGGPRPLWILAHARGVDDVLVMYHPHYYVQRRLAGRLAGYAALFALTRLKSTTFVVHEQDDPRPDPVGRPGRLSFWLEERLRRRLWARRVTLVFHTEWEQRRFAERFPGRGRTERLAGHGDFFTTPVDATPSEARAELGIAKDRMILLCIGFFSPEKPDKGYDAAIRAFGEAAVDGVELHVVGSAIARPVEAVRRYVEELRSLAAETPNVHLHEGFVSDEEFDLWLRATDVVVIPYREASSSGVLARAHLLGARVICRRVGGLANQLRDGDIGFDTDEDLVLAIRRLAERPLLY